MIASDAAVIGAADVPPEIRGDERDEAADATAPPGTLKALKAQAERQIVLAALDTHDWHVTRTAEALGLADHSSLLKIMRRHGLSKGSRYVEGGLKPALYGPCVRPDTPQPRGSCPTGHDAKNAGRRTNPRPRRQLPPLPSVSAIRPLPPGVAAGLPCRPPNTFDRDDAVGQQEERTHETQNIT